MPGWHIIVDCQLTRRKRFHCVKAPDGSDPFKSRLLWDCVQWLDAEGVLAYQLVPSEPRRPNTVSALTVSKGP